MTEQETGGGQAGTEPGVKDPSAWTREEHWKVVRAIEEHRLSRVDLFYWQEIDVRQRNPFDLAVEMMLTVGEVKERARQARERLRATFDRPSQEAYLGRWIDGE